jgi:hypothetical protein
MRNRAVGHVTVSVAMPPELHQAVSAAADRASTSFSETLRAIVRGWKLQQETPRLADRPEGEYATH